MRHSLVTWVAVIVPTAFAQIFLTFTCCHPYDQQVAIVCILLRGILPSKH